MKIYTIFCILLHRVFTWLRMILVPGLRCVPSLLYVVFLGVVSPNGIPAYYLQGTANTAKWWGSIALLILVVYHRVQTTEYAPVRTHRQLFLVQYYWYMRWPSRSYTCISYHTFRSLVGRTAIRFCCRLRLPTSIRRFLHPRRQYCAQFETIASVGGAGRAEQRWRKHA